MKPPAGLNLILDAWIPVRRRSGDTETITPWAINDRIDSDPVTAFAWPRPELNAASVELLIGMLSTASQPANQAEWRWNWSDPPGPQALRGRLSHLAPFFDVIGDAGVPAFLQDLEPLDESGLSNPARLLFDSPGAQTAKLNTDLFRRRAPEDTVLSLPAAAIALYAHMSWCASAGVGYRVALRGGGPLVTLPILGHRVFGDTLWGQIWPAVQIRRPDDGRSTRPTHPDWIAYPERVFPWTAQTRTSRPEEDGNDPLEPAAMHPLHVHWGMPRRVRLLAGPTAGRTCAVTGESPITAIVGVQMRNYGINYAAGYPHPHTPQYRTSEKSPLLPTLAKARSARGSRIAGLLATTPDRLRQPAAAIRNFPAEGGGPDAVDPRMRCFGIDSDKAKVVGWVNRTLQVPHAGTPAGVSAVTGCLHPLCKALETVTVMLKIAIKAVTAEAAAGNAGNAIGSRLGDEVEPSLLCAWHDAAKLGSKNGQATVNRAAIEREIRAKCMREMQLAAIRLFDELVPDAYAEHRNPFGRARARHGLLSSLSGRSARGRKLFTEVLDLPVPGDGGQPAPAWCRPAPHRDDRSLQAIAWRWRHKIEGTAKGQTDLARLTHAHTIEQAQRIEATRTLVADLATHCDAHGAAVIAVALALTRQDGGLSAPHIVGRRSRSYGPALSEPAFRRLLQTPRNDLIEPLRQLITAVPDRRVDQRALAADIADWNARVRRNWTDEYLHCHTEPALAIAYQH